MAWLQRMEAIEEALLLQKLLQIRIAICTMSLLQVCRRFADAEMQ